MGTFLFDEIVFGPIRSRRLGLSLGVNLSPVNGKLCNFNCIYCECGWNGGQQQPRFPSREAVREQLEEKLKEMAADGNIPDVITFSGNGEPTMHPDFAAIVDDTISLRYKYVPSAKVSVLSNATMIGKKPVKNALLKVDNNILKLDSAIDSTARLMDNPAPDYSVKKTVELLKEFGGRMILQTMFLRGECGGERVDNTTEEEVAAWLNAVEEIKPQKVMIYTIDRETPAKNLEKVSIEELGKIAERVRARGFECSVSG